jgi:hypothetical protein
MDDLVFNSVKLSADTYYFLYVGEIRAHGLSVMLRESLTRVMNRPVDFIAIVADVFEEYGYENIMVINPKAQQLRARRQRPVSCRIPARTFASLVSDHPRVLKLVHDLLARQGEVFVYMYESLPELTLDRIPGVRILGPEKNLARRWNNRFYQYKALSGLIPAPDFQICNTRADLERTVRQLLAKWRDGVFVSTAFSAAGTGSIVALSEEDFKNRVHYLPAGQGTQYMIARYIPHQYNPTVLGVVGNEHDVYIASVADQIIVDYNKFRGSTFPSVLPPATIETLKEETRIVGKRLGASGYRGVFGCDYIVNDQHDIFFVEVNARKQGTTLETCCALENLLPPGSPAIPEMEYFAVKENRLPESAVELSSDDSRLHWGTYNYKLEQDVLTRSRVANGEGERELFRSFATGNSGDGGYRILEHIGPSYLVKSGSFLGRVVAVGRDHFSVQKGLAEGKRRIEESILASEESGECYDDRRKPSGPRDRRVHARPAR